MPLARGGGLELDAVKRNRGKPGFQANITLELRSVQPLWEAYNQRARLGERFGAQAPRGPPHFSRNGVQMWIAARYIGFGLDEVETGPDGDWAIGNDQPYLLGQTENIGESGEVYPFALRSRMVELVLQYYALFQDPMATFEYFVTSRHGSPFTSLLGADFDICAHGWLASLDPADVVKRVREWCRQRSSEIGQDVADMTDWEALEAAMAEQS
jgi:hypothetical protein